MGETDDTDQTDDGRSLRKTERRPPSLLARLLVGGVLAYMGLKNFRDIEGQVGYAEAKGVPYADQLVPFGSGMLCAGSLGVVLWRLPVVSAGAIASFLLGVTPTMHDFWNEDDEGQRQVEFYQFVKNVAILGAAVELLRQGLDQH
jgi:uncharacterized membrane protein YphA (DoxX/SURF4 family)